MSDRIDHAAEAMRLLTTSPLTAEAQVHATLALVEQQRIANLIALLALPDDEARDMQTVGVSFSDVLVQIREGLGLS